MPMSCYVIYATWLLEQWLNSDMIVYAQNQEKGKLHCDLTKSLKEIAHFEFRLKVQFRLCYLHNL